MSTAPICADPTNCTACGSCPKGASATGGTGIAGAMAYADSKRGRNCCAICGRDHGANAPPRARAIRGRGVVLACVECDGELARMQRDSWS